MATTKEKAVKVGNVTMILGDANIDKTIKSIGSRGQKWIYDVHQCALSILYHMDSLGKDGQVTNDYTKSNDLIAAMPKGIKTNALIDWFVAFGRLDYDEDEKKIVYNKDKVTDLEGGSVKPWSEFRPEPAYRPVDLNADLLKLVKNHGMRLKRQKDETDPVKLANYKKDQIDSTLLDSLATLINLDLSTMEVKEPVKVRKAKVA
jgi:hypothetical protein